MKCLLFGNTLRCNFEPIFKISLFFLNEFLRNEALGFAAYTVAKSTVLCSFNFPRSLTFCHICMLQVTEIHVRTSVLKDLSTTFHFKAESAAKGELAEFNSILLQLMFFFFVPLGVI